MNEAYVSIGTNLGDRAAQLDFALRSLAALPDTRIAALSPVFETDPVGPPPQGAYLNAVVRVETALAPRALLDALLAIERAAGRERGARNAARTLDLDLLLYGDRIVDEPGLIVPHPRLAERAFILEPLAALAPVLVHPRARRVDRVARRARARPAMRFGCGRAEAQSVRFAISKWSRTHGGPSPSLLTMRTPWREPSTPAASATSRSHERSARCTAAVVVGDAQFEAQLGALRVVRSECDVQRGAADGGVRQSVRDEQHEQLQVLAGAAHDDADVGHLDGHRHAAAHRLAQQRLEPAHERRDVGLFERVLASLHARGDRTGEARAALHLALDQVARFGDERVVLAFVGEAERLAEDRREGIVERVRSAHRESPQQLEARDFLRERFARVLRRFERVNGSGHRLRVSSRSRSGLSGESRLAPLAPASGSSVGRLHFALGSRRLARLATSAHAQELRDGDCLSPAGLRKCRV